MESRSLGGASRGCGLTALGGAVVWEPGAFDVEEALLSIEAVDGYWRRPAAPAALLATLEDKEPML